MYFDLRDFLKELEEIGELIRISTKIEDGHEVFSIIWELNRKKGPAIILEKIEGYEIPIVANIFGSLDRFAMACGFPRGLTIREYRNLFIDRLKKDNWTKPHLVDSAPCKEVILTGGQVDLNKFPILKWHPEDGGPYITLPVVITKDREYGVNAGIYRLMVYDRKTTGIMCNIFQDIGICLGKARNEGRKGIECAVAIGVDPAIYVAAVTKIPLSENELELAASFRDGVPIDVVKCETVDLEVPASAEIVLEGEISIYDKKREGPYGEWMGYFEEEMLLPIFEVKCITHRKNPFYLTTIEGPNLGDAEIIRMIPQISTFTLQAKERITGFKDAWLPPSGRNYTAFVSIKKRYPGWGKVAIYQTFSIPFVASSVNCVIVTDEDIDISNLEDVIWALSTRVDPIHDVILTPSIGVYPLNPSGYLRPFELASTGFTDITMCSKIGIDATLKMKEEGRNRPIAKIVKPKENILKHVIENWNKYGLP